MFEYCQMELSQIVVFVKEPGRYEIFHCRRKLHSQVEVPETAASINPCTSSIKETVFCRENVMIGIRPTC